MKACAVFFKKLGINNPSEKTVQNLVATVICARQQVTKVEVSCDDRLAALRMFKEYLRNIPLQYEGPTVYCETPEELRTRHPGLYAHAYSAEPPAEARVSERDVSLELGAGLQCAALQVRLLLQWVLGILSPVQASTMS